MRGGVERAYVVEEDLHGFVPSIIQRMVATVVRHENVTLHASAKFFGIKT